jgi:competence protein ComEA
MKIKTLCILVAAASLCLAVMADDEAQSLPGGPGKEIAVKACFDCHGSANFRKKRLTEDEWWEQVGDMVDRGAKANGQEQAALVAYLSKNFGKNSKVNMNTAPLAELRTVLDLSTADSQAIVTYRPGNAPFKEWRDLLKVPGLDAAKLEVKKEMMIF